MFKTINSIRQAYGLPKLRGSWSLVFSATRYARRMMRSDYFGHQARIPVASGWGAAGETLAWHRGLAAAAAADGAAAGCIRPPTGPCCCHRGSARIGVGKARGNFAGTRATMWVVHVGRR